MNSTPPQPASDPATDAEGHPVGTAVGAALGGAAAGALTGSVAGPVGTVIGIALGAIAGGLAGKEFAQMIDPDAEEKYWRDTYDTRDYVPSGSDYGDFAPAFSYGISVCDRYPGQSFQDLEAVMSADWSRARGNSSLDWQQARPAVRDAWLRVVSSNPSARPTDAA